jgi:putative transposase
VTQKKTFINKFKGKHPISWFLSLIGLSSKTWYGKTKPRDDESDYWIKDELIEPLMADDKHYYGYRKVTKELKRQWKINHKKIQRIMKKFGLIQKRKKYKPKTTNSNHKLFKHPNLIADIVPSHPNQIWASDITYIKLATGAHVYLAGLIDVYTKKIRGWALMNTLSVELVLEAWENALQSNSGPQFHHGDRGSQYCAQDYVKAVQQTGTRISMSEPGESTQNPYIESFWRSLKVEEMYMNEYNSIDEARKHIQRFIEVVYTTKRIHSSLDYLTPDEFETNWQNANPLLSCKSINTTLEQTEFTSVS